MTETKSYQSKRGAKLIRFLIPRIFCSLLYFPLKLIFKLFFSFKVQSQEDLKELQGPLVIVSSHASWIDPFLIATAFPFFSRVAPIHYATWWKYYYFPIFTPLVWLSGGFPVRKGIGLERALLVASEILKQGGVVGIFPTGKRTRKWNEPYQPRAKRGAAYLAIKNNVPILPVKIEGSIGMNFKSFLRKKYKVKIKIGRMFYISYQDLSDPENLNYSANLIMNKITNL